MRPIMTDSLFSKNGFMPSPPQSVTQQRILLAAVDRTMAVRASPEYGAGDRDCARRLSRPLLRAKTMLALRDGVALQADGRLRGAQQVAVRRTVRSMAVVTVLDHGSMFEYLWAANRLVTCKTLFGLGFQCGVSAAMRIMAAGARHCALLHRVVRSHLELRVNVLMALDACCRVPVCPVGREAQALGSRDDV